MFPVHSRIEIIFSKWTSDKMCDAHSELLEKCYFLCTKIFVFIIHANIFRNSSLLNSKTGLCYKQMCECFFSGKQRLTIIILSQYSFPIIITEMRLIEYNEPSLYTINSEWSQKRMEQIISMYDWRIHERCSLLITFREDGFEYIKKKIQYTGKMLYMSIPQ